jgi:hypothetical protein
MHYSFQFIQRYLTGKAAKSTEDTMQARHAQLMISEARMMIMRGVRECNLRDLLQDLKTPSTARRQETH